jgi:DNA-binding LytR/AlgR family response regulator
MQNLYDIYLYGYVIGDVDDRGFWSVFPYNFITTAWYLLLTVALKQSVEWYRLRKEITLLQFELKKAGSFYKNGNQPSSIFLKSGTKQIRTEVNTITHVQGLKDYSIIFTVNDKIIVKGSLKTVEEQLPEHLFFRIHKSYLVSKDKIRAIKNNTLTVGDHLIPVGRNYRHVLSGFLSQMQLSKP